MAGNFLAIGLSITFFWWLANHGLERQLLAQAAHQQQQLQNGWRWEFEDLSDLVGRGATGLEEFRLNQGQLSGYRGPGSGFISLNFRGRRLDASIHHILQIRIWLQRAAPLGIFHTEILGGPVISTPAIALQAGWQLIELDLAKANWQANTYQNQKRIFGPTPTHWGGKSRIVSSLRLHPSMAANNRFEIDWIRLISSEPTPWSLRPRVELTSLAPLSPTALASLRAPLLVLPAQLNTVERVLEFRDLISRYQAAASLIPKAVDIHADPEPISPGYSWMTLAITWLVGLTAILATLVAKQQKSTRAVAIIQITGLLLLATLLLTWADKSLLDDARLAVTLSLMTALAATILWQARTSQLGKPKMNAKATADTALLITVCIIPLCVLSLFNDQMSHPPLTEILPRLGRYLVWASLQQLLLCGILFGIMKRMGLQPAMAILAASLVFGLSHFPNFALMSGSLVLAQICLWLYRRHDSLLPGVVLHAVLGTLYLELMPIGILRSGAIGMRYFF